MSAAAASSSSAVDASSSSGGKKRKEPTAAEAAQAQLLDEIFSADSHATLSRARKILDEAHPPKKRKEEGQASSSSAAAAKKKEESNPFVAAMDRLPDTTTVNGAPSFSSTSSPTLDFFFHLVRGSADGDVERELAAAWEEDAETALRILLHARDCHGAGKGERHVARVGLLWLRREKPRTYLANLLGFLRAGYFKDLVVIADTLQGSSLAQTAPLQRKLGKVGKKQKKPAKITAQEAEQVERRRKELEQLRKGQPSVAIKQRWGPLGGPELELSLLAEFLRSDYVKLRNWKQARHRFFAAQKEAKASAAASSAAKPADPEADALNFEEDVEVVDLNLGDEEGWEEVGQKVGEMSLKDAESQPKPDAVMKDASAAPPSFCFLSLAAKWAPSERHAFPAQAKTLARLIFAQGCDEFKSAAHMQLCMKKYRVMLSTLRRHIGVTERLCCAGKWTQINFSAVPSRAHQLLKNAFVKHAPEQYAAYMEKVKKGDAKINVTGLEPLQCVEHYLKHTYSDDAVNDTIEEAWKALVARVGAQGTLTSGVSVVDVSGSMSGTPMNCAIAMGLLVAELCEGPFHNRVLTFDSNPAWHVVKEATLKDKVAKLSRAPWGGSTNLQKTFDLILELAVQNKVKQEHMPQTLFIYSDMQFNQAVEGNFMETNYAAVVRKFTEAGYAVPQIVFWNVNGALCRDAPVKMDQQGCALMSGYSGMLLKVFLQGTKAFQPINIMHEAIKEYEVNMDESER